MLDPRWGEVHRAKAWWSRGPFLLLLAFFPWSGPLGFSMGAPALSDGRATLEPTRSGDLNEIKTALRDSNKFVRKDAVEDLAQRSEPEAWELMVEALGDRAGEVADSAAFLLAGMPEGRAMRGVRAQVFGREGLGSKDVQVRRYAAELIGRLGGAIDMDALVKAMGDKDAAVRRLVVFSVQRLAQRDALAGGDRKDLRRSLERLAWKDKQPLVRARALAALCALGEEECAHLLERAGKETAPELRAAAAALWTSTRDGRERTLRELVRLAADPVFCVRHAAVAGLSRAARSPIDFAPRREALGALVERLELESESALAWRIMDELRSLSGRKSGRDPRPWKSWLATLGPDWLAAPLGPEDSGSGRGPKEARVEERSASLAGLSIRSGNVAFLIDFSGSTWRERSDGRTVKEVLDEELRAALEALPEETRFLLVPFTGEPHPWRDDLVEASPRNVRRALGWFEKARFSGTGAAWEALLLAMDVEGVDTIVLLSDGAPSGGVRYRLELITALLEERNLGRQIFLDCILVDASRKLRRLWGRLCLATGGRVHAVSF